MEFRILGPLEVRDGDRSIPFAGRKPRALLGVLGLHANEAVSTARLAEELWGERAPATAEKLVQGYAHALRKQLGDALVTRARGYALRVGEGELDLFEFARLREQARDLPVATASEVLTRALSLWRGRALADVELEGSSRHEVERPNELHLATLVERIETDLALGRHAELVGELDALVAAHPLDERLRRQLMLALYGSGRQAEALEVYQRTRRLLVDELGIEPSSELRTIEKAILTHDSVLSVPPQPPRPTLQTEAAAQQRDLVDRDSSVPTPTRLERARETAALPSGTVTFLFTDVERSTRLLRELGEERYAETLAEHRRIVRGAAARCGGVEVDTAGDSLFVAFPTARGALDAARAAQAGLRSRSIPVRMGLHTGTPLLTAEGYVGLDVHRAARIAAAGHGGQVLLSRSTRELVDVAVRDLGDHRLRDLSAPERLYQLGDDEFPPLRTLHPTNLPIPATLFLGRERELAEVEALVRAKRLVTLTGPGGSGKTRLALQAAGSAADAFDAGVWWVSLAALRDPSLVVPAAAAALGATSDLGEHVGDKRLLLLLDNFEHLIPAAPEVAALLERCPGLVLLVTSRERLRLDGEWEYVVDPLREPEAVELFETRARAVRHDFTANGAVREICARLDNLPLAIELAAARAKVLSTGALLERLQRRLPVLAGGTRDAPERQRTLRATIEWSHGLLSEEEQTLFRRLAVFAGGCTVEAAEAVCDAELDTLASLIDKSLVRQTHDRFWMLETIREFASEQLDAAGEADEFAQRHARFFLALAEAANLVAEAGGPRRHQLVNRDQDNLRAALSWCEASGRIELALQIVVALENHWANAAPREGLDWLDRLLPRADAIPRQLRARALRVIGGAGARAGDYERAERGTVEGLAEARAAGDELAVGIALHRLAVLAVWRKDFVGGSRLAEESLAVARRLAFPKLEAQALGTLGDIAWEDGDREAALDLLLRSAELAEHVGFGWWEAGVLISLAEHGAELGRLDDAERWALRATQIGHSISGREAVLEALAAVAAIARRRGDLARAGLLWGAIEAEEERAPLGDWNAYRDAAAARVVSDDEVFAAAHDKGRKLTLEAAVEQALASPD
jgi:predicted ATPase/class 3 adenylate cyclase